MIEPHDRYNPFPTTRWSLVERAGGHSTIKQNALNELLTNYLPAIRSYLLAKKKARPDQVDDLVQGFILSKVLEKGLLAQADQDRGKFRTFLLTVLNRYVVSEYRRSSALKRNAGPSAHLDQVPDPPAADTDEQRDLAFDLEWARRILDLTLERMKQECEFSHRQNVWSIFEARLVRPYYNQVPECPYQELVEQLGLESPTQASNLLITAKRIFSRHMRDVIGQYTSDPEEIEQEITDLIRVLSGASR